MRFTTRLIFLLFAWLAWCLGAIASRDASICISFIYFQFLFAAAVAASAIADRNHRRFGACFSLGFLSFVLLCHFVWRFGGAEFFSQTIIAGPFYSWTDQLLELRQYADRPTERRDRLMILHVLLASACSISGILTFLIALILQPNKSPAHETA